MSVDEDVYQIHVPDDGGLSQGAEQTKARVLRLRLRGRLLRSQVHAADAVPHSIKGSCKGIFTEADRRPLPVGEVDIRAQDDGAAAVVKFRSQGRGEGVHLVRVIDHVRILLSASPVGKDFSGRRFRISTHGCVFGRDFLRAVGFFAASDMLCVLVISVKFCIFPVPGRLCIHSAFLILIILRRFFILRFIL